MKPETEKALAKSARDLADADKMMSVGLHEAAARNAYMAAFYAAQAMIFEISGKVTKTHKGVHAEFARLTKDDPSFGAELRGFLSRAYNYKSFADYDDGPFSEVTKSNSEAALTASRDFINAVTSIITRSA